MVTSELRQPLRDGVVQGSGKEACRSIVPANVPTKQRAHHARTERERKGRKAVS